MVLSFYLFKFGVYSAKKFRFVMFGFAVVAILLNQTLSCRVKRHLKLTVLQSNRNCSGLVSRRTHFSNARCLFAQVPKQIQDSTVPLHILNSNKML